MRYEDVVKQIAYWQRRKINTVYQHCASHSKYTS